MSDQEQVPVYDRERFRASVLGGLHTRLKELGFHEMSPLVLDDGETVFGLPVRKVQPEGQERVSWWTELRALETHSVYLPSIGLEGNEWGKRLEFSFDKESNQPQIYFVTQPYGPGSRWYSADSRCLVGDDLLWFYRYRPHFTIAELDHNLKEIL